ncbi:hypothetical protein QBC34DRAFT_216504 [Podospora aff. communis PSN243]|uniref:ATP-dependent DNA ligase family profile domain-containing protein n=1 Tax=Podospora aff. communis PSN243 TaxID=3040156 RepID=A0AAV9GZ47_9PEZI|nr:hypothetical protein QBC34DRAFT_216504 [Podospora aff. communis PSN243]
MPFRFSYVCDLLQRLEDNQRAWSGVRTNADIIREWFGTHRGLIAREDQDATPLLSTLLPEKRSDRVYCIKERRLQTIVGRGLGLGRSRIQQLARWTEPGSGVDLAECVESILRETPNPVSVTQRDVTVEDIDELLHDIASGCRFSSPEVRGTYSGLRLTEREADLGDVYKRLSARDAKWLTRLVLKNFAPVVFDPQLIYRNYHPFLPAIIKVQDDLAVAGRILANVQRNRTVTGKADLAEFLKPALGVKIGRQPWIKGRSIKHCLDMSHGRMSCEEKMDGEYCQIHIDLSKGRNCIQIFSKSGKDSTMDRIALHGSIRESLQLGKPSCPIKKGCILEGELLVYSDKDAKILDFHKIRKHVSRSGSFLGTDQDSQRHPWEHLMIVYYDLFMIDDKSLLSVRQSERFKRLKKLITCFPGRSALVKREIIDCDRRAAASDLRRAFAKCIVARGEGLVLKPDDPYFDFDSRRRPYSCCAIKLKKEYVGNFGDIGDFAVVGARYEAAKARTCPIPHLKWTHFYVGCLENKEEVVRFQRKPRFVVTNVVELNQTQLQMFVTHVNPQSVSWEENTAISLRVEPGVDNGKRPSIVFVEPPVFDIRCFSFDKEGNTGFWSPRFPMVNKIHCDRTYHDALSFAELQEIAAKEKEQPPPEDSQELLGWIAALENADPRSAAADMASQSTVLSTEAPNSSSQASIATTGTERPRSRDTRQSPPSSPVTARRPPTPPRPSTAHRLENTTTDMSVARQRRSSEGRKRTAEDPTPFSPGRRKSLRCSLEQTSSIIPATHPDCGPSSGQRAPLSDVKDSSSRRNNDHNFRPRLAGVNSMYQPNLDHDESRGAIIIPASLPSSMSFQEPSSSRATPRLLSATQSVIIPVTAPSPSLPTGSGSCRFLPGQCTLSNISFLLSPCIAGFLWVTEDLLGSHGVDFIRDPVEWKNDAALTQATDTTGVMSKRPRRKKKVVLVDTRRREATTNFLNRIREVGLKRRNGEPNWVPMFDWRVLEDLREEETKCGKRGEKPGSRLTMNHQGSIWRKRWVGLA